MREDSRTDERSPGSGFDPADFRALRNRPTPEFDGARAWLRLRTALRGEAPRRAGGGAWTPTAALARLGHRLRLRPLPALAAAVLLAAVAVAVALWRPPTADRRAANWVLLAEPTASPATVADTPSYTIEFRLLRAYRGTPPADALPQLRGAGGADILRDVADTLAVLLPDRRPAVVGLGETELQAGSVALPLSERYALRFLVEQEGNGPPRLRDVRLRGAEAEVVAEELALDPDHVYLFGVRDLGVGDAGGSTAATGPGELLLAVRLRARPATAAPRR